MDVVKDIVEFLLQFKENPIDWIYIIWASLISGLIIIMIEFYESTVVKKHKFNTTAVIFRILIEIACIFIVIWLFGSAAFFISLIISIIIAFFMQQKYFNFLKDDLLTKEIIKNCSELSRLKKEFKETPHYSILEVLLYYGYISQLQKEYVETENIFKTPEEMAEKFLTIPSLTDKQLKEAKAIMNVIRREGEVLTKQDALLLISKIEERRKENEEDLDEGGK